MKLVSTPLKKTTMRSSSQKKFKNLRVLNLRNYIPKKTLNSLLGVPLVNPFSAHTRKNKNRSSDERWSLLDDFGKLIEEVKPELIAFENVPLHQKRGYLYELL